MTADEQQQIFEPARDIAGGAGAGREAFVDDQLECVGDARRRARRDQQRQSGDRDMRPGSAAAKPQTIRRFLIERPLGRLRRGGHGRSRLAAVCG